MYAGCLCSRGWVSASVWTLEVLPDRLEHPTCRWGWELLWSLFMIRQTQQGSKPTPRGCFPMIKQEFYMEPQGKGWTLCKAMIGPRCLAGVGIFQKDPSRKQQWDIQQGVSAKPTMFGDCEEADCFRIKLWWSCSYDFIVPCHHKNIKLKLLWLQW